VPSRGTNITPAHPCRDFKFRDYAPFVFRLLRDKFSIDSADYLISLTGDYILSEIVSPGKSGSFFYFSHDTRFMLKTITNFETKFLKKILPSYYQVLLLMTFVVIFGMPLFLFLILFLFLLFLTLFQQQQQQQTNKQTNKQINKQQQHVMEHPNTLIARFFGFHSVKPHNGRRYHFVVMGNIFAQSLAIHERYDLKGSTVGRTVGEVKKKDPNVVMKDLDFQRKICLGPEKQHLFFQQLQHDCKYLESRNIMDYSLLLGIHKPFADYTFELETGDGAGSSFSESRILHNGGGGGTMMEVSEDEFEDEEA
jgi:1-phosphatidylinositol-4-phosphate 5-kinase